MFIHPSQVEEVVAVFSEIQAAQAVVEREQGRDKLTFFAVLDQDSSQEELLSPLQERIHAVLKLRADVAFVQASDLREPDKRVLDLRKWD
jgi:phenylacetate-coenzyme A ligase PaaK-like adenylate-forming protein